MCGVGRRHKGLVTGTSWPSRRALPTGVRRTYRHRGDATGIACPLHSTVACTTCMCVYAWGRMCISSVSRVAAGQPGQLPTAQHSGMHYLHVWGLGEIRLRAILVCGGWERARA